MEVFSRMAGMAEEGDGFPMLAVVIIAWGLLLQLCGPALYRVFTRGLAALPWPLQAVLAGLCGALILNMGPEGTLRFIYTGF